MILAWRKHCFHKAQGSRRSRSKFQLVTSVKWSITTRPDQTRPFRFSRDISLGENLAWARSSSYTGKNPERALEKWGTKFGTENEKLPSFRSSSLSKHTESSEFSDLKERDSSESVPNKTLFLFQFFFLFVRYLFIQQKSVKEKYDFFPGSYGFMGKTWLLFVRFFSRLKECVKPGSPGTKPNKKQFPTTEIHLGVKWRRISWSSCDQNQTWENNQENTKNPLFINRTKTAEYSRTIVLLLDRACQQGSKIFSKQFWRISKQTKRMSECDNTHEKKETCSRPGKETHKRICIYIESSQRISLGFYGWRTIFNTRTHPFPRDHIHGT